MIFLPDVVGPTVAYLNTLPDITTLVGDRIGTELPARAVWPAIRLDPTGGPTLLEHRLAQERLQVQCFDPTDLGAMRLAHVARAALSAMAGYRQAGVIVVVDVTTSTPQLIDDQQRTPPIAHATFAAVITARPDP